MKLVDLTLPVPETKAVLKEVRIRSGTADYTGMTYDLALNSMDGTYIDFPGHIRETDDGLDAGNYPIDKLFRVKASVVHLDRASGSGPVSGADLEAALSIDARRVDSSALILNALGKRRFDEIEPRSVFLTLDAIDWIVSRNIHLLVSDIYESRAIHGVFTELFRHGIATVCCPVNLDKLTARTVRISVFHFPIEGVTQLPCRVIAEIEE